MNYVLTLYTLQLIIILFSANCENPYIEIDNANNTLMELEEMHNKLLSQAVLFEIPQPEPNILLSTKKTLRVNKQLWDFVCVVKGWIDVWNMTLWSEVDTEHMDMELKRFAKDLKGITFSHLKNVLI